MYVQAEAWIDAIEMASGALAAPQAKYYNDSDTDRISESEPEETRAGAVKRKISEVMSQVSRILWQQGESSEAPHTSAGAGKQRGLGERGPLRGVEDREKGSTRLGVAAGAGEVQRRGREDTREDCDDDGRDLVATKGATEIGEFGRAWEGDEAEMGRTISNAPTAFLVTKEGRAGEDVLSNVSKTSSAVKADIAQLERQIALLESPDQGSGDAGAKDAAFFSTRLQGAAEPVSRSPTSAQAEELVALECEALLRQLNARETAPTGDAAARRSQNGVETSDMDDCPGGWSINHPEGLSARDEAASAGAEVGGMGARVWAEGGPGVTGVGEQGGGGSGHGRWRVSVPRGKDAAEDSMSARDSGPPQRSSVSSRADSERTPRYSAT